MFQVDASGGLASTDLAVAGRLCLGDSAVTVGCRGKDLGSMAVAVPPVYRNSENMISALTQHVSWR